MTPTLHDLSTLIQFADKGIVSKSLYDSPDLKLVLFCFEAGQALSEHTAPFEAVIHVQQGSAVATLGGVAHTVQAGSVIVMPRGLPHAITARERLVFILTMAKSSKA